MTAHTHFTNSFSAPVVALHSSASSSHQWKHLEETLSHRFTMSAPNLPGYGGEAVMHTACADGVRMVAAPIIQHIAGFGQPVHLVGHSFGAAVALKIALTMPHLVKSLTVYEPAAFHFLKSGDGAEQALFDKIYDVSQAVSDSHAAGSPTRGMQAFIDFWNGTGAWDSMPEHTRDGLSTLAPSIMADFANGLSETWSLADLADLPMPVLMLTGMDSPDIAQHVATRIADAIPHSRLALLPGMGHMAPVFEPDWVNPRIYEHIISTERPAANCYWPQLSAA
ncbi:MAG: alpha/beta hydrolase [Alphaproteobacteria bacterium]|nr:alpha/beta hydrolase [Alphaproteobacteria bacterium]